MMSPISFLIMLLIMIIIPTILYTLFFLINFPPTLVAIFRGRSENSGEEMGLGGSKMGDHVDEDKSHCKNSMENVTMSSKLVMEKGLECPICLSMFLDGEELKKVKICKHVFHKNCIDKWLSTHFNCPVCRAFISKNYKIKKDKEDGNNIGGASTSRSVDRSDLWQGLPDSAGLV